MSLTAHYLETHGLPTLILGSALDVVEHCGVARFAYLDFPLGNPCGKPYDADMQRDVVFAAIDLFESAEASRTTLRLPQRWSDSESWRDDYMAVREEDLAILRRKGEERRAGRQALREAGRVRR